MENFRIESLEINKIGAFEHLKMDFPKKTDPEKAEIHILTGENGTGKSTILNLMTGIADNSNENFYFSRILTKGKGDISGYHINYTKKKDERSYFRRQTNTDGFYTSPEALQNEHDLTYLTDFAFFAYSNNRYINAHTKDDKSNENEYFKPLQDAVNFTKTAHSNSFINWILSTKTRALVAKSNGDEFEYQSYIGSIAAVENAISEITNLSIEFVLLSKPFLNVALQIDGVELSFEVLPDGIKSMIIWMGDLLMRLESIDWSDKSKISLHQTFVLFLDEIEVHLHPAWQRKILPVVQKLFKNAQIFISTHSPFVVGSVDGAWVHKLKKVGAYAVLDGEPVLSEDAESYDTILEEIFGIKERFGNEIESKLDRFRKITKEILKGNEQNLEEWNAIITFFQNQNRPDEIMAVIAPQVHQINRIRKQVIA
ncbi:AAA family ATPase [Arcicella rosea]|uniref:Putative ATP-binding protein involved in virulence n=1 Tax=Arcicella rosea TaxID=502909 RepID=A0A841ENV2_9BACT|nr:AAA family ATPase [Arcicella rosea]MBB6003059.1 putative ATP-binding protein involved in virulence [Arcicella rosea]